MSESYTINTGETHTGKESIKGAALSISGGRIEEIQEKPGSKSDYDLSSYSVMPAFSDIHTHGYFGVDAYFGDGEGIGQWAEKLYSTGVASFVPTLVSLPIDSILEQFRKYKQIMQAQRSGATVLGMRCEGPYLSMEKRGAHNKDHLRVPELDEVEELFSKGKGVLKIIDIAPEIGNFPEIVKLGEKYGVKISAGHSNATFRQATDAFDSGASIVTHFYNAMSGLSHDDSGMVGAGLLNTSVPLELIADFHHVPREGIRIMERMRGMDRVALITDSLPIGGSDGGNFSIGGLDIIEKGGVAWIKGTDTIAGSVLTLDRAVRNLAGMGFPMATLAHASSTIQAEILGMQGSGTIEKGNAADLTILDRDYGVAAVIHKGKATFDRDGLF